MNEYPSTKNTKLKEAFSTVRYLQNVDLNIALLNPITHKVSGECKS